MNSKWSKAVSRDRDYTLNDGGGLYVLVRSNRSKLWRMKYRLGGKEKVMSFGIYLAVSPQPIKI